MRESFAHDCLKAYRKSVIWPGTAVRRRHAARVGAAGIAHVGHVLISMRYHSHSRANGRAPWAQRATADHQAQPRREHLAPHGETHGSCRDLALHRHGAGTAARRSTCSLSKNRPVAHQADCICSLAPATSTVTDEHAEMRGGAGRAQRQLLEEWTWSLCSAE